MALRRRCSQYNCKMQNMIGKVALVTGGTKGLGRAIADTLLGRGCKVAILGRDETSGRQTVVGLLKKHSNGSCVFYKCDVSKDGQLEDAFIQTKNHFGAIDIVVNNAGLFDETNWQQVFDVNIKGYFSGITLGMKYMSKSNGDKGGHILNVSSVVGIAVVPDMPVYCVSKQAIVAMTRCFGSDLYWNRHGVKVNCICPDPIDTAMWTQVSDFYRNSEDSAHVWRSFDARIMPASMVAEAVLRLLEDEPNGAALLCLKTSGINYYDFPAPVPP